MDLIALRHLLVLLLFFSLPCQAEIYKWFDENGTTQFSDSPREEGSVEAVEIEPAVKIGTVKPQSAAHLFNKDFSKHQYNRQKRQVFAEKRRQQKAALRKACDAAKYDLASAIERRASASSASSKRHQSEKVALAKNREDKACKLSNFR